MKAMHATEYWMAELEDVIDTEEKKAGVTLSTDHYYDIAKALRDRVVLRLFRDADITIRWSYQQSVGASVLIQSATDAERQAFSAAVDAEHDWVTERVRAEIAGVQEFLATQEASDAAHN